MRRDEVAVFLAVSDMVGEPGGVSLWGDGDVRVAFLAGVVDHVEEVR